MLRWNSFPLEIYSMRAIKQNVATEIMSIELLPNFLQNYIDLRK